MSRLHYLRQWRSRLAFWGGAMAVGGVAAAFAALTDWATREHAELAARAPYAAAAALPLALVVLAVLTRRFAPAAAGSGIPQAIAALDAEPAARTGLLSLRIAAAKIALTTAGLLAGGSMGREGPTVHVGAAIMHSLGRWIEVPYQSVQRSLILAGGAAGIAAAFNTPIAGIVFAIEEMARSFEERTTGVVLSAVVLAGITSVGLLGNYVYFGQSHVELPSARAWFAVLVCALVAGAAGGLFSRVLISLSRHLAPYRAARPVATIAALGLLLAALALWSGGSTYGSGYAEAKDLLAAPHPPATAFPLLKWLATLLTYLTGVPGGIFSPSLSTGVGIGANVALLFPSVPATATMIVGMVAYFAGVTQAPMTGAIIVMEMVDNHELILPVLGAAFIASAISKLICARSLYVALAEPFRSKS